MSTVEALQEERHAARWAQPMAAPSFLRPATIKDANEQTRRVWSPTGFTNQAGSARVFEGRSSKSVQGDLADFRGTYGERAADVARRAELAARRAEREEEEAERAAEAAREEERERFSS